MMTYLLPVRAQAVGPTHPIRPRGLGLVRRRAGGGRAGRGAEQEVFFDAAAAATGPG